MHLTGALPMITVYGHEAGRDKVHADAIQIPIREVDTALHAMALFRYPTIYVEEDLRRQKREQPDSLAVTNRLSGPTYSSRDTTADENFIGLRRHDVDRLGSNAHGLLLVDDVEKFVNDLGGHLLKGIHTATEMNRANTVKDLSFKDGGLPVFRRNLVAAHPRLPIVAGNIACGLALKNPTAPFELQTYKTQRGAYRALAK